MRMDNTTTTTDRKPLVSIQKQLKKPVLLVASAPPGIIGVDRLSVPAFLTAGRSSECSLTIRDKQISKQHFRITQARGQTSIEDLESTNGTFVNGHKIETNHVLTNQSVIRFGQIVLVFIDDNALLMDPPTSDNHGMAGRFHTNALIKELRETSLSARSVLVTGPSGSGKELAAGALASMIAGNDSERPFLAHNAGLFATEDEATSTLFGVGPKVFSGVDARAGLIDQVNGGTLFLDEINNLPMRVQQSLLRVIEDGKTKRIGETTAKDADVRFVFASNKNDQYCGLAPDLFARLRVVRISPLKDRAADVPSIFNTILTSTCQAQNIDPQTVLPLLAGDHYEALCLDGFEGTNVRGLINIADRLVTKVSAGATPAEAVVSTFSDFFDKGVIAERGSEELEEVATTENRTNSRYENNKEAIIEVYRQQNKNISATERVLKDNGINANRRWLTHFLEEWGQR